MSLKNEKICGLINYNEQNITKIKDIDQLPKHIVLETNSTCQLKCPFCEHHSVYSVYPKREMNQLVWECISNIPETYNINICLTDTGEPFLFSRLSELIDILLRKKVTLEILTNGLLLDEKHIKLIANPFLNFKIMVSLDAINSSMLSEIRKCEHSQAKKILKNVSFIKETFTNSGLNNVRLIANILIVKQNLEHLCDIISFASEHSFDEVHMFHPIILFKDILYYSVVSEPEIWKPIINRCKELANKRGLTILCPPTTDYNNPEESSPICPFCWSSTWIMADGSVKPCCKPGTPILGDLVNESLQSIWLGKKYNKFRETMLLNELPSPCARCFFRWESVGRILPNNYHIWDDNATAYELISRCNKIGGC